MNQTTNQKTALVTGGSRGIGRAISRRLAADGFHVVINYKSNVAEANQTLELINQQGGSAELSQFDLTDRESTQAKLEELIKQRGSIEVLVNNAGIVSDQLLVMMSAEKWDSVINTSLTGFYNVTKPVVQNMLRKKNGVIVSLASVAGIKGNKGQTNYAAAKAGIIGASKALAIEVGTRGIRVNVVAPGLIDTEMISGAPLEQLQKEIPMGRIGNVDEVAAVISFLCSDESSYITGQVICVDGGMTR